MVKVESNLSHIYICAGENIFPGVNYVDNEVFMAHPHVKSRIESGLFVVQEQNADISKVTAKKLIADIKEMYDIKKLKMIMKADNRETVINAAKAQIESLALTDDEKAK